MAEEFFRSGAAVSDRAGYDAGLRAHMQRVFNYMGGGLALTGLIIFLVGAFFPPATVAALSGVFGLLSFFFIIYVSFASQTASPAKMRVLYWLYCGAMGFVMSWITLSFTQQSIYRAFFITAATFAASSLWGYSTKSDLTGMGAFMRMGMIGLLIALVVNIFFASPMLQWVSSVAGVLIFTGLTAWHVQWIKQTYSAGWGPDANDKLAVFGALKLYLSFINLFQFILMLGGNRR